MNKEDYVLCGENIYKEYILAKNLIGKTIKVFKSVKGIELGVKCGETLGVVGESGSGKSTTGEILGDLQKPTSGNEYYMAKIFPK